MLNEKLNTKIKSSIRDNHQRGSVGEFLKDNLNENAEVSIVSAYFTIYAYQQLKNHLDNVGHVNFLFGEPRFLKNLDPEKTDKKAFKIEDENISLENRLEQKTAAKECAEWIMGQVSIKSMVRPNFLHGKLYHIKNSNGVEKAIAGSSNFTVNGLGLGTSSNIELNLVITDERDREDLYDWFHEFWDENGIHNDIVQDVKDEVLKYLEQLYIDNSPEFIYYKTLFHIFEKYLSEQSEGDLINLRTGYFDSVIWNTLYDFQKDGVKGAINKILKYNGCIIADSVGLGKTYEALAVIKYFESLNNRVLVLCPKKLRENWTIWKANDERNPLIEDRLRYDVLSHTDLNRNGGKSGDIDLSTLNWGNYDLVVIDESHNFRNNATGKEDDEGNYKMSRYEFLMEKVIKSGIQTKILLLSATPVNNNLRDLRNQFYLITENRNDALLEEGIKNIAETMRVAQLQFSYWANPKRNPNRRVEDLLERLDSAFFKLLDELTIARSRNHIKRYYDTSKIGEFPKRNPVNSVYSEIDISNRFPSYDRLYKDISNYRLSVYNPSAYVLDEWKDHYQELAGRKVQAFTQESREHFLIGMMRVNFLKRLESSIESFEISIDRTIRKIEKLEEKIKEFREFSQQNGFVDENETDPDYDEGDEELDEALSVGKKLRFHLGHLDLDLWLKDLNEDKDQLLYILHAAESVSPEKDAKLFELKKLIREKCRNPLNTSNKKVIVFTAFSDTAKYLYNALKDWVLEELQLHIAVVTGGTSDNKTSFKPASFKRQSDFNAILTNFSPVSKKRSKMKLTMPQEGEIDILIATDCISEGQNLQDCDYLINYDIHWNPVRIIQRFGRVDRLGSKNNVIQMVNFWPTKDLNKYINLKDRVEARMALVDITATGEENLLDTQQVKDLVLEDMNYRDKQLLRLKDEVLDLEDLDENITLSEFTLDDFRMELMNFLEAHRRLLEDTPFGLYSIVPCPTGEYQDLADYDIDNPNFNKVVKPGVIFCLRQKGNTRESEEVNPLQPYFLVYIRTDGTVRFRYTSTKQILDVYRSLCQGKKYPYEKLCDLFNDETSHGKEMKEYNQLLRLAIKDIARVFNKRSASKLKGRGGKLIPQDQKADKAEKFDLITWLIVK